MGTEKYRPGNPKIAALGIAGVLVLLLLLAVPGARASIDNTSHDVVSGSFGTCAPCHVPYKYTGSRLWPPSMSARKSFVGETGALCYYCHGAGSPYPSAVQYNIMELTQGAYSHGLDISGMPKGGNNLVNATDLPYSGGTGDIQCTTCHDPHTDDFRPFLRKPYETLCQDCHSRRSVSCGPNSAFVPWSVRNVGDNNLVGSHPIGPDVTGDVSGGASPIDFNLTPYINVVRSNATDNWSLGGHLGEEGGVMCGSCHAPHGVDIDETLPSAELFPSPDLLVYRQSFGSGDEEGSANGNQDGNNRLCEACHTRGDKPTINPPGGIPYVATSWNAIGQGGTSQETAYGKQPNPGGTSYTHPVDDLGSTSPASVTGFPPGWPSGGPAAGGANVGPVPICESCHTPHPAANNEARASVEAGNGTPILRTATYLLCERCHGTSWSGHHPTGQGLMTTRFNGASSLVGPGGNGMIGNGDSNLTCADCHNGSGAHNWGWMGVGLDPDWVPPNNARGPEDKVGGYLGMPDNAAHFADSCKQCHMCTQDGTPHQSPTKNGKDDGSLVTHDWRSSEGYEDLGEGTHYIGDNLTNLYANGYFAGTAFNAVSDVWDNVTGTTGTARGGWSRWYGKLGSVGCQSCHELEPDKNVPGTALLLAWFNDGQTEALNNANDPSSFCEGCHGRTPAGGNPHPMTGATIGRALTGGRTPPTLMTKPGPGVFLGEGAPTRNGGTSTFPGDDMLNCDSCHQVHDAATAGGTYLYEAPSSHVTGVPTVFGPPNYLPLRGSSTIDLEDRGFCKQCHSY